MKLDGRAIDLILARKIMSRTDLANNCGLSKQAVSNLIRREICTTKAAGKLALGLGVDVSEIVCKTEGSKD